MNYAGVDLHKEHSWFYVIDEFGTKISSKNISNKGGELKRYLEKIPQPFKLAVEATYNWYFFVDLAEQYACDVYLANSYELKAFARRNKKTDKIDAHLIAEVLRKGYLPTVTIVDKDTRYTREVLKYRMDLVRDRSRIIHRLKALLDRNGRCSEGNYTVIKRLNVLEEREKDKRHQLMIEGNIRQIKFLNEQMKTPEKKIEEIVKKDSDLMNLITIDGLTYFSAALVKSEIINVNRFKTFNRLCAYAGLAPRVHQSANKCIHGPLNKNRRKNLQWILIENVFHFIKADRNRNEKYLAIKKRKNANAAKIVMARDFLKIIYHVLKEKRPYYREGLQINKVRSEAASALCRV